MLKAFDEHPDLNKLKNFNELPQIRKLAFSKIVGDLLKALGLSKEFSQLGDPTITNNIIMNIGKLEHAFIVKISTNGANIDNMKLFISAYNTYLLKIRSLINDKTLEKTVGDGKMVNNFVYMICMNPDMNHAEIINCQRNSIISDSISNEVKKNIEIRTNQTIVAKTTDTVECPKCKMRKVTFTTKQVKSADEPETAFYNCVNCNYSWSV